MIKDLQKCIKNTDLSITVIHHHHHLSRIRPPGLFWFRIYFLKFMNLLDSW